MKKIIAGILSAVITVGALGVAACDADNNKYGGLIPSIPAGVTLHELTSESEMNAALDRIHKWYMNLENKSQNGSITYYTNTSQTYYNDETSETTNTVVYSDMQIAKGDDGNEKIYCAKNCAYSVNGEEKFNQPYSISLNDGIEIEISGDEVNCKKYLINYDANYAFWQYDRYYVVYENNTAYHADSRIFDYLISYSIMGIKHHFYGKDYERDYWDSLISSGYFTEEDLNHKKFTFKSSIKIMANGDKYWVETSEEIVTPDTKTLFEGAAYIDLSAGIAEDEIKENEIPAEMADTVLFLDCADVSSAANDILNGNDLVCSLSGGGEFAKAHIALRFCNAELSDGLLLYYYNRTYDNDDLEGKMSQNGNQLILDGDFIRQMLMTPIDDRGFVTIPNAVLLTLSYTDSTEKYFAESTITLFPLQYPAP